jgi:hypothetical protein
VSFALAAATDAVEVFSPRFRRIGIRTAGRRPCLCRAGFCVTCPGRGEAARPLTRGWQLAASRDYQDLLGFARPALTIAYEADPAGFAGIWHAETGTDAPDWLTRPGGSAT